MNSIDLSIVIVNYNVKYFLEQALLAVQKAAQDLSVEVFVVDNNSVDDSVQMVQQKFPDVKLIANKHNPGFSIANNQAIRRARGKYVLLLNPDTVVEEDTFVKCFNFMEAHPKAGALGVKMIDGTGAFLPESKRGFPSPFTAFCKTFGLANFFPKSSTFNRYYMGHLSKDETNPVDVLAGAFMWIRKSVLDKIGLLDEQFFMYGEDIDLSYRISLAGFQNYYFADTAIIHYKGESTKKGSLNYVRVFYNAMILFAQKHFQGQQASLFILILKGAIYFRAFLTLFSNSIKQLYLPFLDATVIYWGLIFLKNFWSNYHFKQADYYPDWLIYFNFPIYTLIWLTGIYFNGSYEQKGDLRRLVRGVLLGTVIIAAIYGFLPLEYRASRAIIILGTIWTLTSTTLLRLILHFIQFRNFKIGKTKLKNLIIIGSLPESKRVQQLLSQANVEQNFIGTVAPETINHSTEYLSAMEQLSEVVQIYDVEEIIFCSKDVSSETIMKWMTQLGATIDYKIVPLESISIIGSHSKNAPGELYTIDVQYNINQPLQRRNKRLLDVLLSFLVLLTFPLHLLFIKHRIQFTKNLMQVLLNQKSWVGYAAANHSSLPKLKRGVLDITDHVNKNIQLNTSTLERLNFFYAKDYSIDKDIEIIWKSYHKLGKASS